MVNANLIIKYICAVLLPPVGVFLVRVCVKRGHREKRRETWRGADLPPLTHARSFVSLPFPQEKGLGTEFWLDLLLTLLVFIPGIIYAVYIIFNANRGGLTGGAV